MNNNQASKKIKDLMVFFSKINSLELYEDFEFYNVFFKKYRNDFTKDEHVLGELYELYLDSIRIRKKSGIYYTPNYIIKYILKYTVEILFDRCIENLKNYLIDLDYENCKKTLKNIKELKILDPACGSGYFLIEIFRVLWRKYQKIKEILISFESKYSKSENSEKFKELYRHLVDYRDLLCLENNNKLLLMIIYRHIYGVDFDFNAVQIARFNLYKIITNFAKENIDNIDINMINHLFSIMRLNLVQGDSLIDFNDAKIVELIQKTYSTDIKKLFKYKEEVVETNFGGGSVEKIINSKEKISNDLKIELKKQLNSYKDNQLSPFFYYIEFWHVFFNDSAPLELKDYPGFDIVLGNPPYFTEVRGYKDLFRQYRKSPAIGDYYEQKMDIFYFFIERGLDLLKEKGYLGYIILDYWESRTFGNNLRRKIAKDSIILNIIEFNEFKVFEGARGQHNSIIILQKNSKNKKNEITVDYKIKVLSITDKNIPKETLIEILLNGYKNKGVVNRSLMLIKDETRVIRLEDFKSMEILKKMRGKRNFKIPDDHIMQGLVIPQSKVRHSHLKNLKNRDIEVGDGIFVLSNAEKSRFKLNVEEKNLIKPFHIAQDLDSFYYEPKENEWLIYISKPYIEYDKNDLNRIIMEKNFSRQKALKNVLSEMERKYPTIINHLNNFQKIITSDKKPYGLHRPRIEEVFESRTKIISVRKTSYPKFVFVPIDYYIDQSVYNIIMEKEDHIFYLVGLFNSKLAWFFFKKTKTHGNQLQVDKSVLKRFPIVMSLEKKRDIDNLVKKINNLKADGNNSSDSKRIRDLILELDIYFFKIYEIELDQVLFILDFLEIGDEEKKKIITRYDNKSRKLVA